MKSQQDVSQLVSIEKQEIPAADVVTIQEESTTEKKELSSEQILLDQISIQLNQLQYEDNIRSLILAYIGTYQADLTGKNLRENKDDTKHKHWKDRIAAKFAGLGVFLAVAELMKTDKDVSFYCLGREKDYHSTSECINIVEKNIVKQISVSYFHCLILKYNGKSIIIDLGSLTTIVSYYKNKFNPKQRQETEEIGQSILDKFKNTLKHKEHLDIFTVLYSSFKEDFLSVVEYSYCSQIDSSEKNKYLMRWSTEEEKLIKSSVKEVQWCALPAEFKLHLGIRENCIKVKLTLSNENKLSNMTDELIDVKKMIQSLKYEDNMQALILEYIAKYQTILTGKDLIAKPKLPEEYSHNKLHKNKIAAKFAGLVVFLAIAELMKTEKNISFYCFGRDKNYQSGNQSIVEIKQEQFDKKNSIGAFHCLIFKSNTESILIDLGNTNTAISYDEHQFGKDQLQKATEIGKLISEKFTDIKDKHLAIFKLLYSSFEQDFCYTVIEDDVGIVDQIKQKKEHNNSFYASSAKPGQQNESVVKKIESSVRGLQWLPLPSEYTLVLGNSSNCVEIKMAQNNEVKQVLH